MKIEAGDIMVKKSRTSLEEIITYIENLSQTMEEIAAASSEQAGGVDELNRAISQIDSTTQQNSATVEELASTSDNLSSEAKHLANVVERFKVSNIIDPESKVRKHGKAAASPLPVREVRLSSAPRPSAPSLENDFEEF